MLRRRMRSLTTWRFGILSNGFKRAQLVLDQNRDLIQRVNDNLRSRIPDNVASNVSLINEINVNISIVMEIYSDLSVDFTKKFHERPPVPELNL